MGNMLILYGFKKNAYSRTFVSVPEIMNAEFKRIPMIPLSLWLTKQILQSELTKSCIINW